ncbi:MAG: WG repeat-containing protein [Eubacteriales bacterium]|jgi:tetratricopeptide (TPR) repeat protein
MRQIIAFGIAAIIILTAWTMTTIHMNAPRREDEAVKYTALAEKQCAAGAYGSAISLYSRAISIEDSPELRLKLARAWKAYGNPAKYRNELKDLIRAYPDSIHAYELLAEHYYENADFSDCCTVIKNAKSIGLTSDKLESLYHKSAYLYDVLDEVYDDAGVFVNGYAKVQRGGQVYLINSNLREIDPIGYDLADVFFGNSAAVSVEGKSYFIDRNGKKYMVTDENYTELYSFSNGRAAVKRSGSYSYIDIFGELLPMELEFASTFYNGISAVCDEQGWFLIDTKGAPLIEDRYEDIKLDENNTIGSGIICLVKNKGYYYMFDLHKMQVYPSSFEDCKAPIGDNLVAVMQNGMWGFADTSGEICIEPVFEEAMTFSCGFAAVKRDGMWGFIDYTGRTVIDFEFEGAKCFSDNGMAPVKIEGKWRFIKLKYRESLYERF